MDFFAHQDAARRSSTMLLGVMVLAIAVVVVGVNVAVFLTVMGAGEYAPGFPMTWRQVRPEMVAWITLATLVVIGGGSLAAWFGLRGGGRAVAESLGGREVHHAIANADERRLLNVVEEMSLASGVPTPPVFIIEDQGLNAFAAGYRLDDAAIGVTRGLIALPRDELQGVIAHEYSHILNGDMRLNMRLIAAVAGLLAVAGVGRAVVHMALRSGHRSSSRGKNNPLPFIILGGLLFIIGMLGWFLGRWIQAAFSRRREFLADASAVQFTRNPGGIGGALKRIQTGGSGVTAERATDVAHLFFADALRSRIAGLFATHPPLGERIARIEGLPLPTGATGQGAGIAAGAMGFGGSPGRAAQVVELAGAVSPDRLHLGTALLSRLPAALLEAAHEPVTARAVSLLPLLPSAPDEAGRLVNLVHTRDPWLAGEVRRLLPAWSALDADRARWPLLQVAHPALAALSPRQAAAHLALAQALADADGLLTLREFCVLRHLRRVLTPRLPDVARHRLREVTAPLATVLGALAHAAGGDVVAQDQAFAVGWRRLPLPGTPPSRPSPSTCGPLALGPALDELAGLDAAGLRAFIDACAHAVAADGTVSAREAELLQLVAIDLGVPIPAFADRRDTGPA